VGSPDLTRASVKDAERVVELLRQMSISAHPLTASTIAAVLHFPSAPTELVLDSPFSRVVNVSSVPMRSPFRYPGGKTWLIPSVRRWLTAVRPKPTELIEPFAGGGTVGLTAAFEGLVRHSTLVELDTDVASVWETMLGPDAEWFARRVRDFSLTNASIDRVLYRKPTNVRELAFVTLLRNRVNRGGILAAGAGKSKYGEKGKGVASRWYPETLSDRILAINAARDKIQFVHGDGLSVMRGNAHRSGAAFFIDPPYTAAGKKAGLRLYRHAIIDHEAIFDAAEGVKGDFLMTYDDTDEVEAMARRHGFDFVRVPMKSTHHAEMTEMLIGRDLTWARRRTLFVGGPGRAKDGI
jgi:DNA adenine methylase